MDVVLPCIRIDGHWISEREALDPQEDYHFWKWISNALVIVKLTPMGQLVFMLVEMDACDGGGPSGGGCQAGHSTINRV